MADKKNSERKEVLVTRRYGDATHKIFVSTVITKNGARVLEQFRVPINVEVNLPVEIIVVLKERKVAKFFDGKQKLVPEFSL